MDPLNIVFAGSPAVAVPSLTALTDGAHRVVSVVTREDAPLGRRRLLTPTPVAQAAEASGIPLIKTNRLDDEATRQIAELQPDLGVIVAYGGLVREPLLSTPRLGWINLHFSLLPRWRGAAPVQHSLISGDELTGATIFRLVPELDAGDVYGQLTQSLTGDETAGALLETLAFSGAHLLRGVVDSIADGSARAEPQLGDVTLAPKLTLDDARLDFTQPARAVFDRFRGVTPEPGAHTEFDGGRLKILAVAPAPNASSLPPGRFSLVDGHLLVGTATHPLELRTVQPAGRRAMSAADWWRGQHRVSA